MTNNRVIYKIYMNGMETVLWAKGYEWESVCAGDVIVPLLKFVALNGPSAGKVHIVPESKIDAIVQDKAGNL